MKRSLLSIIAILTFIPILYSDSSTSWIFNGEEDGVKLYRQEPVDGIIPFKAVAEVGLSIEALSKTLRDLDNKHKWSPKLKEVAIHKKINNNTFIFSEYYKTPWPATDREFLMLGEVKGVGTNEVSFTAKSDMDPKLIQKYQLNNHIQAKISKLDLTLSKIDVSKTKISFEFQGDLKGWMPQWLTNIIQKKWPKLFIQNMEAYIKGELK